MAVSGFCQLVGVGGCWCLPALSHLIQNGGVGLVYTPWQLALARHRRQRQISCPFSCPCVRVCGVRECMFRFRLRFGVGLHVSAHLFALCVGPGAAPGAVAMCKRT